MLRGRLWIGCWLLAGCGGGPGQVDPDHSHAFVDHPTGVPADGRARAVITAVLRDSEWRPVPNVEVGLHPLDNIQAITVEGPSPSDRQGISRGEIRSDLSGAIRIRVVVFQASSPVVIDELLVWFVPSCGDGIRNGRETGADCGGADCTACVLGETCNLHSDCASGFCAGSGTCAAPSCGDDTINGDESDTDCGGATCPACGDGRDCRVANDCASGVCALQFCQPALCDDTVLNGDETDTDCGGPDCPRCGVDRTCSDFQDCTTSFCEATICQYATGCQELFTAGLTDDGVQTIDLDGAAPEQPFKVYCGMTLFDGGWTLAAVAVGTASRNIMVPDEVGTVAELNSRTVSAKMSDARINAIFTGLVLHATVGSPGEWISGTHPTSVWNTNQTHSRPVSDISFGTGSTIDGQIASMGTFGELCQTALGNCGLGSVAMCADEMNYGCTVEMAFYLANPSTGRNFSSGNMPGNFQLLFVK